MKTAFMTPAENVGNQSQKTKIIETDEIKLLVELGNDGREKIVEILRYPDNYRL